MCSKKAHFQFSKSLKEKTLFDMSDLIPYIPFSGVPPSFRRTTQIGSQTNIYTITVFDRSQITPCVQLSSRRYRFSLPTIGSIPFSTPRNGQHFRQKIDNFN